MTISSTNRIAGPFTGTGAPAAYPFNFKAFITSDVRVVSTNTLTGVNTDLTLNTDYSVTLNANQNVDPGGVVTMVVAPPTGTLTTLTTKVPNTQPADLTNAGTFYPQTVNDSLDRATIQIQQLSAGGFLTLPVSASSAKTELPYPIANTVVGWDATGTKLVNYTPTTAPLPTDLVRQIALAANFTSTGATVGGAYLLNGHTVDGKGGGAFEGVASGGLVADYGTIFPSSVTPSVWFRRVLSSRIVLGEYFGLLGTGDETAKIANIEASAFTYVDLGGLTITITSTALSLTKKYSNGTIISNNQVIVHDRLVARAEDLDISSGSKCHVLDWAGQNVLWLGTSIPAFGGLGAYTYGTQPTGDSYPFLFGQALGCSIQNYAWASSHAYFDIAANPNTGIAVNALSMTEDDRVALLALYGASSDYSDTGPGTSITKPSQMTVDYRIKAQMAAGTTTTVILDHAHNDRLQLPGTLAPESLTITAITKGATTQITVASIGTVVVGNAIALSGNTGIFKLNYAAARVQAVAGNVITLNINSSGYTGTFTSGTVAKVDRNTIYGAWDFLISYVKNMSYVYGDGSVKIVLAGAPSEYTGNTPDPTIYSIARYIKNVSNKWALSFYDVANDMKIQYEDHIYFLPDGTHPSTSITRKAMAAYWIRWASGGVVLKKDDAAYLPLAIGTLQEQRDAWYSKFYGGFATANHFVADPVSLFTEDFSGTLAAWTSAGTGTPVIVTAPWNGAQKAVKFPITNVNTASNISRSAAFQQGVSVQFDVAISSTSITASSFAVCNVMVIGHPNTGNHYAINLVATPTSLALRIEAYTGLSTTGNVIVYDLGPGSLLSGTTKRNIKLQAFRELGTDKGSILLYMDNSATPYAAPYRISDVAQVNNTAIYFGVTTFNNTAGTFDVYVGNIAVGSITVSDMTTRFTGTTGTTPNLLTFVNGICISKT